MSPKFEYFDTSISNQSELNLALNDLNIAAFDRYIYSIFSATVPLLTATRSENRIFTIFQSSNETKIEIKSIKPLHNEHTIQNITRPFSTNFTSLSFGGNSSNLHAGNGQTKKNSEQKHTYNAHYA